MSTEEKELLLKDLCARLPYGVKIEGYKLPCIILNSDWLHFMYTHQEFALRRPYLRPMSSMTKEERKEYKHLVAFSGSPDGAANFVDWLNKKMFAYRTIDGKDKDMFELGIAIRAPEGMYE